MEELTTITKEFVEEYCKKAVGEESLMQYLIDEIDGKSEPTDLLEDYLLYIEDI